MKFTFINTVYEFDRQKLCTLDVVANDRDEAERLLRCLVRNPEEWRVQV